MTTRPAIFVVKATISPEVEGAFNDWYDTVRSREAAQVPGCLGMRRYRALSIDTPHRGSEPWQYMVCYEFDSEDSLRAFVRSDTLRAMTFPIVEVHMTNIDRRGLKSITAEAAHGVIAGFGINSYLLGLDALLRLLADRGANR